MALLEVANLEAFYGPTQVLHGLSFAVPEGGIATLLGANGMTGLRKRGSPNAARALRHGNDARRHSVC